MAKFYIEALVEARIGFPENSIGDTKRIITTTFVCEGKVIRDVEYIDVYKRYEEFYEYDFWEAEPFAKDEFKTINYKGEKSDYYSSKGYVIKNIIKKFEEEVKFVEE